ncbi:hypothetical protein chiPu_0028143, partial [Chiloscyllium punctatum]|nr:hypothetical protein [Chiloscyllium punctatum]
MAAERPGGSESTVWDPQHSNKLLKSLSSFRNEPLFCDAVLVVEGHEIPVQKNLLAAVSPYVRSGRGTRGGHG